jgi:hypothetical protein
MVFEKGRAPWLRKNDPPRPWLSTTWPNASGKAGVIKAYPYHILVPLYHKIRIPINIVLEAVSGFDSWLKWSGPTWSSIEWDVYLVLLNDLKTELLGTSGFDNGDRLREVLWAPMPRFLWRAVARIQDRPVLELLFDATDIAQGEIFVGSIIYDENRAHLLSRTARMLSIIMPEETQASLVGRIFRWFQDNA